MVGRRLIALLHLAGQVDAVEADREERREIVRDARVELAIGPPEDRDGAGAVAVDRIEIVVAPVPRRARGEAVFLVEADDVVAPRSEEHTSELQSLMRSSYAVFCLKKKKKNFNHNITTNP